jgi:phosphomannomutase
VAIGSELRSAVEAWIADDPDPVDRAELASLLDHALDEDELPIVIVEDGDPDLLADEVVALTADGDAEEAASQLADRFAARLTFGTAGLRGHIGAGPNRMNRAVVRAATSAVAGWLLESAGTGRGESGPDAATGLRVVIGCDARHRSAEFADEAARVLAAAGIGISLLPQPCPTPLVAFAVRHLFAQAGIMVTASHNPRTDNGYKLYLSDGAQIVPPLDREIERRIAALGPLLEIPVARLDDPLITRHGDEVAEAYIDAITAGGALLTAEGSPSGGEPEHLRVVYTPMHGVAGELLLRAVERAGFPKPHVVTVQAQPDPDFPTAAFPNPEEPAALTLGLADAKALDADLMLANDPDGDRLAVAVPEPDTRRKVRNIPGTEVPEDGRWRVLTGDQVGALLGSFLLERERTADDGGPTPLVATSIVSSTLLSKIAAKAGARYEQTLTGFKWIARAADDKPGTRFAFGYEEAIGYMASDIVRDKDGIGAAVAFLRLATGAARAGRSILDLYDALESEHGVHLTSQLSLPVSEAGEVMRQLRAHPPASFGSQQVDSRTDYAGDAHAGLPPSDVLSFRLGSDRVVIRPSGTEPKVKAYFEVVEPVSPGGLIGSRLAAQRRLVPLREAVSALLTGNVHDLGPAAQLIAAPVNL